ncbi:MAG: hypothetical protein ABFS42_08375 [Candidatus Krumholzibacteriota bacterium]
MKFISDGLRFNAKSSKFRTLWNDLRTNPRYSRFGILSALLTACVMTFYLSPIHDLGSETFVWLYTLPAMLAIQSVGFVGGFSLAIAMGTVAAVRPGMRLRALGIISALVSVNYLCEYKTGFRLGESLLWDVQTGIEMAVGIPASLAFDLAGHNPVLACLLLVLIPVLMWVSCRGWVLGFMKARRSAQNRMQQWGFDENF